MARYLTANADCSQREQKRRGSIEEGSKKTGVGLLTTCTAGRTVLPFYLFSYYALNLAVLFVVQKLAFILLIGQCVVSFRCQIPF